MPHEEGVEQRGAAGLVVWSLWHWQARTDERGAEDDELPHLLIGYFARREQAEEVRERVRHQPGLRDWPLGFRVSRDRLDDVSGWEQGFAYDWDDSPPSADRCDVLELPEPAAAMMPREVWDLWHFTLHASAAAIEPLSAKGIGLFSSRANADAAIAHRRRQPGFRDWPAGFRCYRRRIGVVFGRDGFRERYGWEAWRDSIIGEIGEGRRDDASHR